MSASEEHNNLSEKQKMIVGAPYRPADPELERARLASQVWLKRYNLAQGEPEAARLALLAAHFAAVGPDTVVRSPFHCCYGFNITVGAGVFLNFDCVILDVAPVTIGDGAQIGPATQIYSADHPRDPAQRRAGLEMGRPVHIGANVWIGGGAIVLPGITIGDDAIVGAGAVVTRDVAPGATVAGNPARLIRAGS